MTTLLDELARLSSPTATPPADFLLEGEFCPQAPETLQQSGLSESLVESLTIKFLVSRGHATGMQISKQLRLPFKVLAEELRRMKQDQLISHRRSSQLHDYVYELTPLGHDQARRQLQINTYFGSAPVAFDDYLQSVQRQRLIGSHVTPERLQEALRGLSIQRDVFQQIGQAVRAARGLFLWGFPGNGKTSIAERICRSYGPYIWIPRTLLVDGELLRLFDPTVHRPIRIREEANIDQRWVCIERPTVVAGGELTLENLELTKVGDSGVVEAPLQLKSNCGVLVIDDFGRQKCSPTELLNRWIVPLEMKVDYLNLPSGKKLKTPFEQMIVFSTNLRPKQLVDEAFLRRIPYKVEAPNPTESEFLALLQITAASMNVRYDEPAGRYLIARHYQEGGRSFRYCHARDLMLQAKVACEFQQLEPAFHPEIIDQAVKNYFVSMD